MHKNEANLKIYDGQDFPFYLPKLNSLYDDLFAGGKGFRARLIQLVGGHLALTAKQIHLLSQTIEFVHNASLLHDDLVDRSQLRRNKPAAWLKYSPEYAVLAGDYLLARVMVNLSRYGNLDLIQYTAEIISDLLEGEWIQDSLINDWQIGLEALDKVHNLKTASLFKWCLRSPFICRENKNPDLRKILEEVGGILGLLFQRADDLLDFNIRNFENKAILGDLQSGYLNSFAAFLSRDLAQKDRERLKSCKTMAELFQIVGRESFENSVREFDQMNERIIGLYTHRISQLEPFLADSEKGLLEDLLKLPGPIYWRK